MGLLERFRTIFSECSFSSRSNTRYKRSRNNIRDCQSQYFKKEDEHHREMKHPSVDKSLYFAGTFMGDRKIDYSNFEINEGVSPYDVAEMMVQRRLYERVKDNSTTRDDVYFSFDGTELKRGRKGLSPHFDNYRKLDLENNRDFQAIAYRLTQKIKAQGDRWWAYDTVDLSDAYNEVDALIDRQVS